MSNTEQRSVQSIKQVIKDSGTFKQGTMIYSKYDDPLTFIGYISSSGYERKLGAIVCLRTTTGPSIPFSHFCINCIDKNPNLLKDFDSLNRAFTAHNDGILYRITSSMGYLPPASDK